MKGDNFVRSGVTLRGGGKSTEFLAGGNLRIKGRGSHTTFDCVIEEGLGGKLHVSSGSFRLLADQVALLRSRFLNGKNFGDEIGADNIFVLKTLVQDCEIRGKLQRCI